MSVTRQDIEEAADRIGGHVRRTPVLDLGDVLDLGCRLVLKLDQLHPTGSFKVRGAFSALTATDVADAGVVAASGGNFGLAVAYACHRLGHPATIFVPDTSPAEKTEKIREYGAKLEVVAGFYGEALAAADEFMAEQGGTGIHAYDQLEVMAGQGTCGIEIMEQVSDVSTVLVAVGGAGLIGGVASWIRGDAEVIAIESEECPTFHEARKAGKPVDVEIRPGSATSSLGASRVGDIPWTANRWIGDSILVPDEEILAAQRWLWDACRLVAEPSASATLAALRMGKFVPDRGSTVVALISGANTPVEFS